MAVRKFRLEINVLGLLHIGNGQKYGKKDYFAKSGKIVVLDVRKFVSMLAPTQVSRYCDFLEDSRDKTGLQGFLDKKENADLLKIAQCAIAYQIESPIARARRGSIQYHDVWQFVKDPYGNPYIPGSSVKGMLRTALLLSAVLNDAPALRAAVNAKVFVDSKLANSRNVDTELNKMVFWRERRLGSPAPTAVSDVMKYVSVSDSAPLSVRDLVFAKKYDKFSKDDPADHKLDMGKLTLKEGNELDVYRECLRPGSSFSVDISIDERIDEYLVVPVLDGAGLAKVLQRSFDFYSERFLSHFDSVEGGNSSSIKTDGKCQYVIASGLLKGKRCRNNAIGGAGFCETHQDKAGQSSLAREMTCYLGGGVDFMSKTVTSALFDKDEDATRRLAHILYNQSPTKIDWNIHPGLYETVRQAGFNPESFKVITKKDGRIKKAKDDHRHWRDAEIGVSPHTMKCGIVDKERYPMGKCSISIKEL